MLKEVAKDARQLLLNPLFLSENDVDQTALEKEKEIYRVQALKMKETRKIIDKMVNGRIQNILKKYVFKSSLG